MAREKVDGVGVTFSAIACDVAVLTMVVGGGWSYVPPLDAVHYLCSTLLRILVDKDARARRGKRRDVEIKGAAELGVCGQSRIYTRWAKEIECHYSLDNETAQKMKG